MAHGVPIKSAAELEMVRRAGRLAAEVLGMIEAHVVPGVSTETLDRICNDHIVNVQDQEKVLSKFFTIINYITAFAVLLAALMVACAALLMATTIRQAAFIRRREIGIMRLVGASNWTIRMPFIAEMVIVSVLGVSLAAMSARSGTHPSLSSHR